MYTAKLSSKYQVVIPKPVREQLKLKSGQKFQFIVYDGRIELILLGDIKSMRGFVKGIDTSFEREPDRL